MLCEVPTQSNTGLEWGTHNQAPRNALLQRLESLGESASLGLADQEVDVLGHDNVCVVRSPNLCRMRSSAVSKVRLVESDVNSGCR